eukprot:gnl/TRDRNA2_/TRDRNA2_137264_c0_seq1.p1 gnl/TRDRNA2_/TRDRNA2_137264_c0~~gnl/TRDRNA2_/TRDRNA2_137264_c0_seq1.p1  ORF type:complete len:171 (+),score=21.70 gnl/TRDRNA2_/TRDRNA2_137264_c0_seq1:117-629(+)
MLPQVREGWQMSLCQNVAICCPSKLPTKDVFCQRKVPRPVSPERECRRRECSPDNASSPQTPTGEEQDVFTGRVLWPQFGREASSSTAAPEGRLEDVDEMAALRLELERGLSNCGRQRHTAAKPESLQSSADKKLAAAAAAQLLSGLKPGMDIVGALRRACSPIPPPALA